MAKPNRIPQNLFYVGMEEQVDKDTSIAPAFFPEYFDGSIDFTPEIGYEHYRPAGGQFNNLELIQNLAFTQSFSVIATPKIAHFLLAHTLGKDTLTGSEDPYTHTIEYSERKNMPYASLEVSAGYDAEQTDPIIARFVGARIASLTISGESGMPIMINPEFEALNIEKIANEATESYETDKPYLFYNGTYTLDSGEITTITNFELALTNIIDTDDYTNEVTREDLPVIAREGTLNFTIKFNEGSRFWDTYMATGHAGVIKHLKGGDFNLLFENEETADTTGYRSLDIDIPNLDHVSASVSPGTGDDTLSYECEAIIRQDRERNDDFVKVIGKDGNATAYVSA